MTCPNLYAASKERGQELSTSPFLHQALSGVSQFCTGGLGVREHVARPLFPAAAGSEVWLLAGPQHISHQEWRQSHAVTVCFLKGLLRAAFQCVVPDCQPLLHPQPGLMEGLIWARGWSSQGLWASPPRGKLGHHILSLPLALAWMGSCGQRSSSGKWTISPVYLLQLYRLLREPVSGPSSPWFTKDIKVTKSKIQSFHLFYKV